MNSFLKLAVSGPPICIKNKSKGLGISWASRYEEKHTKILTVRERENEKAYRNAKHTPVRVRLGVGEKCVGRI